MNKDYDREVLFEMYKEKNNKVDELSALVSDLTHDLAKVTDKLFHTLTPQSAWMDYILKIRVKHKLDELKDSSND
jgi:outer membrane protein assembly factor BamD (BamD/ComL family)